MSHVLILDSSARKEGSVTRRMTEKLAQDLAPTTITRRDLTQSLPHLTADWIAGAFTPAEARDETHHDALALSDALIEELKAADTVIIGVPIYNFGVPAALKAWIDQIARAGVTFKYTENGPQGLLSGKKAVLAMASGGVAIGSEVDFASGYMRHVLGFVGITDVTIVTKEDLPGEVAA